MTCKLAVTSSAGMDGMRSVVLVEAVGCIDPRDGFLDLITFLRLRFRVISLMIKVKRERSLYYISGEFSPEPKHWR